MSVSIKSRILSGRGLYDGPIPRPEESYGLYVFVSLSMFRCNNNPLHLL